MNHPDPYAPQKNNPQPSAPEAPATRVQKIALFIATALGCVSGPFLFKAAGITNFPGDHLSHYIIIICYATGAITISRWIILKLLTLIPTTAPPESETK